MAKYRILKTSVVNGLGESKVDYRIQKKFLFWYFDYSVTFHYVSINARCEPYNMALIRKLVPLFETEDRARQILSRIENQYKEWYNGNFIIGVFNARGGYEDVFINDYRSIKESRIGIEKYILHYNHNRPHQALGYKTPSMIYFL